MKLGRKLSLGAVASVAALTLVAGPAHATGSVVGTDAKTKEVGGALASCIAFLGPIAGQQSQVYQAVPGVGVIHGQSFYFGNKKGEMGNELAAGSTPKDVIDGLIKQNPKKNPNTAAPLYDGGYQNLQRRQYLIASIGSPAAGFTGQSNEAVIGTPKARIDLQTYDPSKRFRASVGGNTLSSANVIKRMSATFNRPKQDVVAVLSSVLHKQISAADAQKIRTGDLAERLFLTLASGFSDPHQGDTRCTTTGVGSANAGWIRVDAKDGTTTMNLMFRNANQDALPQLAQMFYDCRVGNAPCIATGGESPAVGGTAAAAKALLDI